MSAPITEPISAIDSKIINKIVKAYELKLKETESRGVKRKRESNGDDSEAYKKRKELSENDDVPSECTKLLDEAKQLKRQGDEHKHTSEGVECYIHATLKYTRAAESLVNAKLRQAGLYRSTAAMLIPSVSACQSRGDEQRLALCYTIMAFCYARAFTTLRDKCERDVRHLSELAPEDSKSLASHLGDMFRCLEFWEKARSYESRARTTTLHPLDMRTSELIDHVTQNLSSLKQ